MPAGTYAAGPMDMCPSFTALRSCYLLFAITDPSLRVLEIATTLKNPEHFAMIAVCWQLTAPVYTRRPLVNPAERAASCAPASTTASAAHARNKADTRAQGVPQQRALRVLRQLLNCECCAFGGHVAQVLCSATKTNSELLLLLAGSNFSPQVTDVDLQRGTVGLGCDAGACMSEQGHWVPPWLSAVLARGPFWGDA
jgi:hypothetical protein